MAIPRSAIILIPARLRATRLPNKPLALIHGEPMIVHVWRRAIETGLGRTVVASGDPEISDAIAAAGGEAVLTDPDLPSGSDRIYAALTKIDPDAHHDAIINIQGDLPVLTPETVQAAWQLLDRDAVDIGTVAARITRTEERDNTSVVKAIVAWEDESGEDGPGKESSGGGTAKRGRALYFTRAGAPDGDGPRYHHIGLYAYRRAALERFVALPPSRLEQAERLEQLRALEAGMRIDVACVDTAPFGVDTPGDLERAKTLISPHAP